MMLAARDGAELTVLHVIESVAGSRYYPRTHALPELARIVREQLSHDLGDHAPAAQIRIEEGDPAAVIERVARELQATLVVVGVARVERLGRFVLGSSVERLVRAIEAPLLIVTDRPRKPYERIAVTVDFSPVSTQTIRLAAATFPDRRITAFHAYQPLTYGSSNVQMAMAQWRHVAETKFDEWLAEAKLSPEARVRVVRRIEHGEPSRVIRQAATSSGFDLVVVGTRGRGRLFEFFVGSVAKEILAELPCDALFVRDAKA